MKTTVGRITHPDFVSAFAELARIPLAAKDSFAVLKVGRALELEQNLAGTARREVFSRLGVNKGNYIAVTEPAAQEQLAKEIEELNALGVDLPFTEPIMLPADVRISASALRQLDGFVATP